jgi:inorganic triphosphatase YgiF
MSDPREIELKLDVPVDSLRRLTSSSLFKSAVGATSRPSNVVSVYFDTDGHKLRRKGISLRVRRIGRRLVQTVKQENGTSALLFNRNEWERDIRNRQPELDTLDDTALGPLLTKKVRRGLKPIFETRVRRKVLAIQNGESEVELAIDKGRVEAGRKSLPLCELELELKHGRPADLFSLAKTLAEEVPLQLAIKSKADRGYELVANEKPKALKACPVDFASDADVQSAFRTIARGCLHQLVANQPVMLGGDPEGLHQMRVALRRLRAAISLFSGVLAQPQTNNLKDELKWITGELGPARELEVFLKRVVKPVSAHRSPKGEMAVISRELRQKRRAVNERARLAVESPRFRRLVLDIAAWIEAGDWASDPDDLVQVLRERPIAELAADQLRRRWKAILKKGKHLDELDPPHRHKLRIRAKKLRYAAEFFASAFPRRKSTRRFENFVERLAKLQDALGDLNDIAVHEELSVQLIDGNRAVKPRRSDGMAMKAFAAGRLSGHEEARIVPVLQEAERAYSSFAKAKPFWV